MKNLFCAFFLLILFVSCGESKPETANDIYPEPWREPSGQELATISKVLAANGVSGCADYYVRPAKMSDGEYLVGCSSDGENWTYYMVFAYSGEAMAMTDEEELIKAPVLL